MKRQFTKAAEHLLEEDFATAKQVREFLHSCLHPWYGLRVDTSSAIVFPLDPSHRIVSLEGVDLPSAELLLDQANHDIAWQTLKGYNAMRSTHSGTITVPLYSSKGLITAGAVVATFLTNNVIECLSVNDAADDLFNTALWNVRDAALARSVINSELPKHEWSTAYNVLTNFSSMWPDECSWSTEEILDAMGQEAETSPNQLEYTLTELSDIAHNNNIWHY